MATRAEKLRRIVELAIANGWNYDEFGDDPSRIWTAVPDLEEYMLSDDTHLKSILYDHRFITAVVNGLDDPDRALTIIDHITNERQEQDIIDYFARKVDTLRARAFDRVRVHDAEREEIDPIL